jgi:hypothetical protein
MISIAFCVCPPKRYPEQVEHKRAERIFFFAAFLIPRVGVVVRLRTVTMVRLLMSVRVIDGARVGRSDDRGAAFVDPTAKIRPSRPRRRAGTAIAVGPMAPGAPVLYVVVVVVVTCWVPTTPPAIAGAGGAAVWTGAAYPGVAPAVVA